MNKRGAYFFVIDAFIAASIIFISLIFIFTTHSIKPESEPSLRIMQDYTDLLSSTSIREFQNGYIEGLIDDNNISDLDNTLLEQLTYFYYLNQTGLKDTDDIMEGFLAATTVSTIPSQRNIEIMVNKTLVYSRQNTPKEESNLGISQKLISYERINQSYVYGPVVVEVRIWV